MLIKLHWHLISLETLTTNSYNLPVMKANSIKPLTGAVNVPAFYTQLFPNYLYTVITGCAMKRKTTVIVNPLDTSADPYPTITQISMGAYTGITHPSATNQNQDTQLRHWRVFSKLSTNQVLNNAEDYVPSTSYTVKQNQYVTTKELFGVEDEEIKTDTDFWQACATAGTLVDPVKTWSFFHRGTKLNQAGVNVDYVPTWDCHMYQYVQFFQRVDSNVAIGGPHNVIMDHGEVLVGGDPNLKIECEMEPVINIVDEFEKMDVKQKKWGSKSFIAPKFTK